MKKTDTAKDANVAKIPQDKKPYASPRVIVHGKLNRLTQGSGGNGLDANNTHTKQSDRATKENIIRVGTHPLGIGLYLFDYKPQFRDSCGHVRQFGVMADEVEIVMPSAVSVHTNGYKQVNYAMLGISHNVH
jgi:hypothetical protein